MSMTPHHKLRVNTDELKTVHPACGYYCSASSYKSPKSVCINVKTFVITGTKGEEIDLLLSPVQ